MSLEQRLLSEDMSTVYPELEKELYPMMAGLARRFAPSLRMDFDDAMQEARMAVMKAFSEYDPEKNQNGLRYFGHTCVTNAFKSLFYKATTRARMPQVVYEEAGEKKVARHPVLFAENIDDDHWIADVCDFPQMENDIDSQRIAEAVRRFSLRLMRSLTDRERAVYRCKTLPPDGFMLYLRNVGADPREATNLHVARFLGLSKNEVDWSLHKIKGKFVGLAETDEFSDLVQQLVKTGQWPMIHVSERQNDYEFVRTILQERGLDPRPIPNDSREITIKKDGNGRVTASRIIENYHWGSVIHLRLDERAATVVTEGRFNSTYGDVFGEWGHWKNICDQVSWYKALVRELKKK